MPQTSLTVDTILKMITAELRMAGKRDGLTAVDGRLNAASDLKLTITADVHETEYDFSQRFGTGTSFTFSLSCYEEGKRLAEQILQHTASLHPDFTAGECSQFRRSDLLYLFIYLNFPEAKQQLPAA